MFPPGYGLANKTLCRIMAAIRPKLCFTKAELGCINLQHMAHSTQIACNVMAALLQPENTWHAWYFTDRFAA